MSRAAQGRIDTLAINCRVMLPEGTAWDIHPTSRGFCRSTHSAFLCCHRDPGVSNPLRAAASVTSTRPLAPHSRRTSRFPA
jgi:hypothetical protein